MISSVEEQREAAPARSALAEPESLRTRLAYLQGHPLFRRAPLRTVFRIALWRVRCWLGMHAEIELPRWKARMYLPALWGAAGTTMIFATREDYETELANLHRFVSPGGVVVDAGASCGIYTIAASKLVGDSGRVIAFEPGAQSASVLERNVELNQLRNVSVYREAMSDRVGEAKLYSHRGPVASSIAPGDHEDGAYDEVVTTTLDSVLEREGVGGVDFLKMDIEGAEELGLRGAQSVITRSHPVVVFEMNPPAAVRFGLATDGAWRFLERHDYHFFEFDRAGELRRLDAPPCETNWEFRNVVAIHRDDCERYASAR